MTLTRTRRTRTASTLVELLVAMAVSIGIMWILAEAFKMGLDFARHTRSTGQMMTQLTGAGGVITRDLEAEHFLPEEDKPNRGVRLSDQRLDKLTLGGNNWTPPKGGFFKIVSPIQQFEVFDREGLAINTALNHRLHFAAILPGGIEQNLFAATVPPGSNTVVTSRAAEIEYFLVPIPGVKTTPGPTGQQLYHLIRRQRLLAIDEADKSRLQSYAGTDPNASEVISLFGADVNSLGDIANPARRGPLTQVPVNSPRYGEDILLSNVLSFEVLVDWTPNANGIPGCGAGPRAFVVNTDNPYDYLSQNGANPSLFGKGTFDTWAAIPNWNRFAPPTIATVPQAIRVKSIHITIRVFDSKTQMARQNTWKFGM